MKCMCDVDGVFPHLYFPSVWLLVEPGLSPCADGCDSEAVAPITVAIQSLRSTATSLGSISCEHHHRHSCEGGPNLAPGGDPDPNLQMDSRTPKRGAAGAPQAHNKTLPQPLPAAHPLPSAQIYSYQPSLLTQLPTPLSLSGTQRPTAAQDDTFAISLPFPPSHCAPPSCPAPPAPLCCSPLLRYAFSSCGCSHFFRFGF